VLNLFADSGQGCSSSHIKKRLMKSYFQIMRKQLSLPRCTLICIFLFTGSVACYPQTNNRPDDDGIYLGVEGIEFPALHFYRKGEAHYVMSGPGVGIYAGYAWPTINDNDVSGGFYLNYSYVSGLPNKSNGDIAWYERLSDMSYSMLYVEPFVKKRVNGKYLLICSFPLGVSFSVCTATRTYERPVADILEKPNQLITTGFFIGIGLGAAVFFTDRIMGSAMFRLLGGQKTGGKSYDRYSDVQSARGYRKYPDTSSYVSLGISYRFSLANK
jgi:hypothetical protein